MRRIKVIDSHTEGEPTRLVLSGVPDLGPGPISSRTAVMTSQFEEWYAPLLREPRAFEAVVGAWVGSPTEPGCLRDVIYFNPAGLLGMCGHGTMGVIASLAFLGEIGPGEHRLNTPVGVVTATLREGGAVSVQNVPSWCDQKDVLVEPMGYGAALGDVAWGGNWFFLVYEPQVRPGSASLAEMTEYAWALRRAAEAAGFPEIDHVELFGPPSRPDAQSKNFVLCPSGEYDRSPCGTGTSAKLACLFARGKLAAGEVYVQESVIGTAFRGSVEDLGGGKVRPTIEGTAYVSGLNELLFDPADSLRTGIRL